MKDEAINIDEAAYKFMEAIEKMGDPDRRVIISWSYADKQGEGWKIFGNSIVTEKDWNNTQMLEMIIALIKRQLEGYYNADES